MSEFNKNQKVSKAVSDLIGYLHTHESDIANEINDFGDLKLIFIKLFNREPRSG